MNKAQRKSFHEEIAEQLIIQLQEGPTPWQASWDHRWMTFNQAKEAGYTI